MKFTVSQPFPIVRACVPVPLDMRDVDLWHVDGPNGATLETQHEVVERDASGKPRVIEVIALNPTRATGQFQVHIGVVGAQSHRCIPGPFAAQRLNVPPLFSRDGVLIPTTFDDTPPTSDFLRARRSFHARHFRGWVTVYHGLDIVDIVIDFHNAECNSGHLAFDTLALVGNNLDYATALPEPGMFRTASALGLVAQRLDGLHHVLPQRIGRPWRLVLHDGTQSSTAMKYANGDGWGCAIDEWKATGAFQPQALPLPDLTSKGLEARNILANTWHAWQAAIQNGTSIGIGTNPGQPYPAQGSQTDWLHPAGQQYGGATSGSERYIYCLEGVLTAATGSYDGVLALTARSTLYAQRMPSLILDARGRPDTLEAHLDAAGKPLGGWRMSSANTQFDSGGGHVLDSSFGFSTNAAIPAGACPEFTEQMKYAEIDAQHADRWYQPLVSLAYLTNDPWSKWRIRCHAETWRMMMFSANRLQDEFDRVMANTGHGTEWGRAHGESWTMCCAAYALSGDAFRNEWDSWITQAVGVLAAAQMANGLLRSSIATSKDGSVFAGCWDAVHGVPIYSVTKLSEESQLANFLQAYAGSVGHVDPERIALWSIAQQDFLASSFPAWAAVGPPDRTSPRFIGVSPLIDSHKDKEEVGAGIGHGMWAGAPSLTTLLTAYTGSASNPAQALLMNPLTRQPDVSDWPTMLSKLQRP